MRPSIARRLQIGLISALTVVWVVAATSVAWVVRHETEEVFDSTLQELAQRVLALAVIELDGAAHTGALSDMTVPAEHQEYLTYQVFDGDGNMLMRSHRASLLPFRVSSVPGHHVAGGQHYYVDRSKDDRYVIKVAESVSHREDTYSDMLLYLLLPFGVAIPFSALIIFWAVRRSEAPILHFGKEISKRDSKDLTPLDVSLLPVELTGVGESVNALMLRLERALEAERSFTANSAHELRTPIAAALAQLDVLRDAVEKHADKDRVALARSMVGRLEDMTVKLLHLARAESGKALQLDRMDMNGLTAMLLKDLAYRARHRFNYTAPGHPVWILGDIDTIGIALQNLLENADKHASGDSGIQVCVTANGCFSVRNDCPAIAPDMLARLDQRFVRANQTQAGSGIGLSIVSVIARQGNASFALRSPCFDNGRGFEASICFKPCAAAPEMSSKRPDVQDSRHLTQ